MTTHYPISDPHSVYKPDGLIPIKHLNQFELARRWRISERTLERWRWLKKGPSYLSLGGRVAYRLEDVEKFEKENLKAILPGGTK